MAGISVTTWKGELVAVSDDTFASLGLTDLRRLRFGGKPRPGQAFSGNFVECLFEEAELQDINFSRCDWKDCHLFNTVFFDCDMGSASLITNSYENCRFIRCRFPDTGISDCSFRHCIFEGCDLSNIVMKSNTVTETAFLSCTTSNKIIESSLLIDTHWADTPIELGMILGNFGLRKGDLENCTLYVKQANRELHQVNWDDLVTMHEVQFLSSIERFRLSFFLNGSADGDEKDLECALNPRNWSADAIIEASFSSLLTSFAQFLLILYGSNKIALYAVLRFHTNNFELLEWASEKEELASLYQAAAGVHLTFTREVDSFVNLLQSIVSAHAQSLTAKVAAEGPLDKSYYEDFFNELGQKGIRIVSVRPRNSPVELAISFMDYGTLMAGIALILSARTKFELSKIAARKDHSVRRQIVREQVPDNQQVIRFQSGFSADRPSEYEINVRTLLPRSLLLDLNLSLSVAAFKKVRRVLLNFLDAVDPPATE